jgi:hypothetical protein
MRPLADSPWDYTLYELPDGGLLLLVVCGSVGIYEVERRLTLAEEACYREQGAPFLAWLAKDVRMKG